MAHWAFTMIRLIYFSSVVAAGAIPSLRSRQTFTGVNSNCDDIHLGYQCQTELSHNWGMNSPFFSVPSAISADFPPQCQVTFVQILSRHGARDPTSGATERFNNTVRNLQSRVASFTGVYSFLSNFTYSLGADQLTPFGRQEMINSGIKFSQRYQRLTTDNIPFVRSTDQQRVLDSATLWTQGYSQSSSTGIDLNQTSTIPILILSEAKGINNTLNHDICTNFENGPLSNIGDEAATIFGSTFLPAITARLNNDLPGANLTDAEVEDLMDLCPFYAVTNGLISSSPFCALFTQSEFQSYNYLRTVDKFYSFGPGNPLGPTQGVGFVNELLARLTGVPIDPSLGTSINHTLSDGSNSTTFPLNLPLYADFSHDNDMITILSALGIFNSTLNQPLSTISITPPESPAGAGFSAAWISPFSSRVYVEKMICTGSEEERIRILVNDRVVPLVGCEFDTGTGTCSLSDFINSQSFAKSGGRWLECFS